MGLKALTALISGGLAYIITVLLSLLFGLPLKEVLLRGLIALSLFAGAGWIFIILIKTLQQNGEEEPEEDEVEDKDFAPLNPPILETSEKKGD